VIFTGLGVGLALFVACISKLLGISVVYTFLFVFLIMIICEVLKANAVLVRTCSIYADENKDRYWKKIEENTIIENRLWIDLGCGIAFLFTEPLIGVWIITIIIFLNIFF